MQTEEKKYNYLDDYRDDAFARRHNLEPIVYNDNNIAKVEILGEVEGWDQSKIDGFVGREGNIRFHKYLVKCPKHNEFFQLIEDVPRPWSYNCRHCITDEINKVLSARFIRDNAYRKQTREDRA